VYGRSGREETPDHGPAERTGTPCDDRTATREIQHRWELSPSCRPATANRSRGWPRSPCST